MDPNIKHSGWTAQTREDLVQLDHMKQKLWLQTVGDDFIVNSVKHSHDKEYSMFGIKYTSVNSKVSRGLKGM